MISSKSCAGFYDGYILYSDVFRRISLTMSPFVCDDAFNNRKLWVKNRSDYSDVVIVNGKHGRVTRRCTTALSIALSQLGLKPTDEVWIETTTNNRYISSCVTGTIEKYCRWSRVRTDKTAAILVNHEFGFVYPNLQNLKSIGLPIIEDAAYSMYSEGDEGSVGNYGDFVLYSMAKIFPLQGGGILVTQNGELPCSDLDRDEAAYYYNCYMHYSEQREEIIEGRLKNHAFLKDLFNEMGIDLRIYLKKGEVPGAFLFKAPGTDLDGLKTFMQSQGIECSVFYGEECFFIPCHQNLKEQHLRYMASMVNCFLNNKMILDC